MCLHVTSDLYARDLTNVILIRLEAASSSGALANSRCALV